MKRAQTEESKLKRRADILDATRNLVVEGGCDSWRLEDVAALLGLAKGTLYLYFPTRQAMLAALLREEMEDWWAALGSSADEAFALLSSGLAERPLLVRLMTSVHMGIEAGLAPDGLLELKTWYADFLFRASRRIEELLPNLAGAGGEFLMEYYALVIGAAQLAYPPATVATLLAEREELAVFRIDFEAFLKAALSRLLAGYGAMASLAQTKRRLR